MLHFFMDKAAMEAYLEKEMPDVTIDEPILLELVDSFFVFHIAPTANGYHTLLQFRQEDGDLHQLEDGECDFRRNHTIDEVESKHARLAWTFLEVALRAADHLQQNGFWDQKEKPDPEKGGVYFSWDDNAVTVQLVLGKDRPDLQAMAIMPDGYEAETVMCRPYEDEAEEPDLSGLDDDFDEDDEEDEEDDESSALAQMPRFICDSDMLAVLVGKKPEMKLCDPNLIFLMEYTDKPVTLLHVPAEEAKKLIAKNFQDSQIDEDAESYILFYERTAFPVDSFSLGMIAFGALNRKTGTIMAAVARESVNDYFAAVVSAMLGLNGWLKNNDAYEQYRKLNRETEAMLLEEKTDKITARVVRGKERPSMQCIDLMNMQSLFNREGSVVAARPYMDEISAGWEREMLSIEELTERAEAGDQECMDTLAMMYTNGDDDVEADPVKAVYWFRKMADAGNSTGMFNLGLFYAKGHGVPRDFKLAAEWMKKAEVAGDPDASGPAEMYASMLDAEKKAKQGDAEAQAKLAAALMKLGGSLDQAGSGKDYEESVAWAEKAAAQGNGEAMWVLALAYHHGRGVEKNMDQAIALYKKGADLGNADCMHNLGCEYMSGEHLWKNEKRGFEYVKRAAEKGNGLAMYNLGRAYQFGNGCIGNMQKALEWYEKAQEVLQDPEIEQRVMAFRSLSEIQPDFDQDYDEEEYDPYDNVPLEGTQYEGRADRCEHLRAGTVLQHRISRNKKNEPAIELFHQGGSVGLLSTNESEKIIEFLKKDRITLKVIVKSCVPKSKRGAKARNADVKLTLKIDDKIIGAQTEAEKAEEEARAKEKQAEENRRREEERIRHEAEQKEQEKRRQKQEAEEARKKQEERKKMENSITAARDAAIRRCDGETRKLTEQLNTAEQTLAKLGFFKFGEKKRQQAIIAELQAKLEEIKNEKPQLLAKYERQLAMLPKAEKYQLEVKNENDLLKVTICECALKDGRKHTIGEIIKACPDLNENYQLTSTLLRQLTLSGRVIRTDRNNAAYFELDTPETKAAAAASMTAAQKETQKYKEDILQMMRYGHKYTVNEIMAAVPSVQILSNQRVSAIMRELAREEEVERVEENRIAYFQLR